MLNFQELIDGIAEMEKDVKNMNIDPKDIAVTMRFDEGDEFITKSIHSCGLGLEEDGYLLIFNDLPTTQHAEKIIERDGFKGKVKYDA